MWLFEVGITVKCGQGIVDFCIVLCDTISSYPHEWVLGLYVGHWSVVFTCRLVVQRFNCKRPLYSVTADCACKNCLCRGGTEERQTKESDIAQKIVYHRRTPKLSGRRYRIAPNFHRTKFSQIGLFQIFMEIYFADERVLLATPTFGGCMHCLWLQSQQRHARLLVSKFKRFCSGVNFV